MSDFESSLQQDRLLFDGIFAQINSSDDSAATLDARALILQKDLESRVGREWRLKITNFLAFVVSDAEETLLGDFGTRDQLLELTIITENFPDHFERWLEEASGFEA